MPHEVREFDLGRVRGIWNRTFEVHLGLYAGYVEQLSKLTGSHEAGPAARAAEPALTRSFGSDDAWRADVRELASIRGLGWIARCARRQPGGWSVIEARFVRTR